MQFNCNNIEKKIWEIGLNSHKMTSKERTEYLQEIKKNIHQIDNKHVFNAIGYLLHSYFALMDDYERREYIDVLLCIDEISSEKSGDIMDIIGIIYKLCPDELKKDLYDFVQIISEKCIDRPESIVSLCNCFSYMFDECCIQDQQKIILKLQSVRLVNEYSFLDETIEYTLNIMNGEI